jgi:hypothetical protein
MRDGWCWAKVNLLPVTESRGGAVGFAKPKSDGSVRVWIPKSQLRELEYDVGGDSREIRLGHLVRSIHVPRWIAVQKCLEIVDED